MKLNLRTQQSIVIGSILLALLSVTLFVLYDRGVLTNENPRDTKRMKEMSIIISALELYAREHQGVFPESLDVLSKQKYLTKVYADPVTAKPYKYVLDSEGNYSVCTYVVDYTLKCLFTSSTKIGF